MCIFLFLINKDVVVEVVIGSGKILVFVVLVFEILRKRGSWMKKEIGVIIIILIREFVI